MAPEFNFIVSTEDNALVENVKARASANRQALGNRQELKKAEIAVNTQATKNEAAIRTGATRLTKEQAYEELTATRRGGLRVLNLVMGNGPAHVNHEARIYWELLDENYSTFYRNPGPSDNVTYEKIRSDYSDAIDVAMAELETIYGTKTTNVYVHIIGSQYTSPYLSTYPWPVYPNDPTYELIDGPMAVTDAVPEAIGDRSNIQKITMRADVLDVVGHLRSSGVDVAAYDCIFIQSAYVQPTPRFSGSIGSNYPHYVESYPARPPQIVYDYYYLSLFYPVIFNSSGEPVEGSAPIRNLLDQLNGSDTYAFDDEIEPEYMPDSVVREYTSENVTDTMRQIRKPGKRLVSINSNRYGSGSFILSGFLDLPDGFAYFAVDRTTTPVGGGGRSNAPTWNQAQPLNTVYKRVIPFFSILQSRLRYPLKNVNVLTPTQTFQYARGQGRGPFYEPFAYTYLPVQLRSASRNLDVVLRYAYAVYLANTVAQNSATNTFLQADTHNLTVDVKVDATYLLGDPAHWTPYMLFEVSSAIRTMYAAAMTSKDLRRA